MDRADPPAVPLAVARRAATRILRALSECPFVVRMAATGALRRMEARVPGIELLISTLPEDIDGAQQVCRAVDNLKFTERLPARGHRTWLIQPGIPLEITLVDERPGAFAAAQVERTATPAHRAALRAGGDLPQDCPDEATLYAALGWPALPPELRNTTVPRPPPPHLVGMADIRGVAGLRVAPAGKRSADAMRQRAAEEGYLWALVLPGGPPATSAPAHEAGGPRLFVAVEAEVHAGETVLPPTTAAADLVVLRPSRSAAETAAALSHPAVRVLGHPDEIPGTEVPWFDRRHVSSAGWQLVLEAAGRAGVALAWSGAPHAAWLPDDVHTLARQSGVRVLPTADADDMSDIDNMHCAIGALRGGGWAREDVLGTLDADGFARWLDQGKRT